MKLLYLYVDFFTVIVPFLFSFHPKLRFYKHFKAVFLSIIPVAFIFILWDLLFTKMGVWGFNSDYITGIYFINLPIEEVIFFISVPFACLFTYHCLNIFFKIHWKPKTDHILVIICSSVWLFIGIYMSDKLYTSSTFISLSLVLFALKYYFNIDWLAKLVSIYPVLLIPFFIVNGILTGFGLEKPVVWYNNEENLGIRLSTIPLEDIFYGFELILLNVFCFEFFKKKFRYEV